MQVKDAKSSTLVLRERDHTGCKRVVRKESFGGEREEDWGIV